MKKRLDIWLILGVFLLAFSVWFYLRLMREEGAFVVIETEGKEMGRYSLSESLTVELSSPGGTNRLVIENGTAKITEADCPDRLCVNQKAVRYQGESIICLPHKMTIRIEGGGESGVDAVAQ
ncbi:MAG: NusG domain II-containing protein [Lachnospiraceae bacterium]|nr:NusG domain II-containing protein [Lachnospiraceae bacterium]